MRHETDIFLCCIIQITHCGLGLSLICFGLGLIEFFFASASALASSFSSLINKPGIYIAQSESPCAKASSIIVNNEQKNQF